MNAQNAKKPSIAEEIGRGTTTLTATALDDP